MKAKKISIVIPVYNEKNTVFEIINRVKESNTLSLKKEIIVVDDGSNDGTPEILKKIGGKNLKIIYLDKNHGKGFALRAAFRKATGEIILVQDADLEYHPKDFPQLIRPFLNKKASVVYGSREISGKNKHSSILFHAGGRLLTLITNTLYGSHLTDEATGYKAFRKGVLLKLPLKCQRFEFCPEVTALLLKKGIPITEVPVTYHRRHHNEGKKLKAHDGISAIWTLVRLRFLK